MSDRKLASVQRIVNLEPIEGADKIEKCTVLGWQLVVQKGIHKVGDLVVYCETDSILPPKPEFEFLRERKFRIKTIKLRKQVSQGIAFPLSILPPKKFSSYSEGDDVTSILGIVKHDPEAQSEPVERGYQGKSKILKYLMRFWTFRKLYLTFTRKRTRGWPKWIEKTDETRVQVCASVFTSRFGEQWELTEKLDGSSATFFMHKAGVIGNRTFGVCSRNIYLKKEDDSRWWRAANMYGLKNKMIGLKKDYVIQGEVIGEGIQGNKYGLTGVDFYVFNMLYCGKRLRRDEMSELCTMLGLKMVPFLGVLKMAKCETIEAVKTLVELSKGDSALKPGVKREGIVVRLASDPHVSFKAINPDFLLKYDE